MIHFLRVIPDSDSAVDVATREFLRIASETPPASDMTVTACIDQAYRDECYIFTAYDKEPIGSMVLKPYHSQDGIVLNIVLLGGKDIMHWKDGAKAQVMKVMKQINATALYIVGRYGWLRIFPELELIGAIYKLVPDNDSPAQVLQDSLDR